MIASKNVPWVAVRIALLLITLLLSETVQQSTDDEMTTVTPLFPSNELDNDFENGSISPWMDESPVDSVRWIIRDINSQSPPVPPKPAGVRYLQLVRSTKPGSFAVAKLRSPEFTVSPGDQLKFKFWINSKYNKFNNLEVYVRNSTVESRVIRLSNYSTTNNQQWQNENIYLNVASVANISLVFYGYCGSDSVLDSIAIDDIQVLTSFHPGLTCPPYDPNAYICICGALSCILDLITTTLETTTEPTTDPTNSTTTFETTTEPTTDPSTNQDEYEF